MLAQNPRKESELRPTYTCISIVNELYRPMQWISFGGWEDVIFATYKVRTRYMGVEQ